MAKKPDSKKPGPKKPAYYRKVFNLIWELRGRPSPAERKSARPSIRSATKEALHDLKRPRKKLETIRHDYAELEKAGVLPVKLKAPEDFSRLYRRVLHEGHEETAAARLKLQQAEAEARRLGIDLEHDALIKQRDELESFCSKRAAAASGKSFQRLQYVLEVYGAIPAEEADRKIAEIEEQVAHAETKIRAILAIFEGRARLEREKDYFEQLGKVLAGDG